MIGGEDLNRDSPVLLVDYSKDELQYNNIYHTKYSTIWG